MKLLAAICLLVFVLISCKQNENPKLDINDTTISVDTIQIEDPIEVPKKNLKYFSNERFRKVTVAKIDTDKYRVQGEAQIFEANFNWVVEDGHNELKEGFAITDAGAPNWGKFDFTLNVEKENEFSTLHLILFEISAKDGSRNYELPIPLE